MRSGKVFRDVDLQLLFDLLVAYRAMYNISGTPAAQRQVLAWQHKDFNTCIPAACARNVHIKIIRQSQRYCDQSQYICPVFVSHVCFLATVSSNMTNQMKQREEQMDGGRGGNMETECTGGDGGRWVEMWDAISMLTSFGCFALYPHASTQDYPDPYFRPPGISRHAQSVNLILPPSFTRVRCPEPRPPVVVRVGVRVREPRGQPSHLGWRNKLEDHLG